MERFSPTLTTFVLEQGFYILFHVCKMWMVKIKFQGSIEAAMIFLFGVKTIDDVGDAKERYILEFAPCAIGSNQNS